MDRRACGTGGLEVPVLCVGSWSFGGGAYWGAQEERDVDAVVSLALERGCGFFDTAEMYNEGRSEESLGRALKGRRDRAVIASKVSPDHGYPGMLRRHCEASLARLGTDRIDLYMLHWPLNPPSLRHYSGDPRLQESPPRLEDVAREMDALTREGKILHAGVSNFGPRQLAEAAALGLVPACDEVPYSLLSRGIEAALLGACAAAGIGVLAYMPLMQGLLTGRYATADELPPARARTRHFRGDRPGVRHGERGHEELTFATLAALRAIAAEAGRSLESLALAWAVARPGMTSAVSGARSAAQLAANADAVESPLPPALLAALDAATEDLRRAMGPRVDLFEGEAQDRTW